MFFLIDNSRCMLYTLSMIRTLVRYFIFASIICFIKMLAPLSAFQNNGEDISVTLFREAIKVDLDQRINPPCDIYYLTTSEYCEVLGSKNTQAFQIEARQGYATHRYYFFYANAGMAYFNLSNIDDNAAYCALTLYKESPPGDPIAETEGGNSTLSLQANLPECAWYFLIISTYGCGDYDDNFINCNISYTSPAYDLRIKEAGFDIPYYDGSPGQNFVFPFTAQDTGIHESRQGWISLVLANWKLNMLIL